MRACRGLRGTKVEKMESFAVLVDAGYLLATASELCFGVADRARLDVDTAGLLNWLRQRAADHCALPHLRTYWYDAARDGQPTSQQLDIADLAGVKLRLGRLVKGRQKGVDARIVRDLIVLATQRSVTDVYLVGGDEDVLEAVDFAQDHGMRVVLFALDADEVPALGGDVDEVVTLEPSKLAEFLSLRAEDIRVEGEFDAAAIGRRFAGAWLATAADDEVASLMGSRPQIPSDLDRELVLRAADAKPSHRLDDADRYALRQGFWESLDAAHTQPVTPAEA